MHINTHYAIGIILTSFFNYFFNFSLLEFIFIVMFSFIPDFDVFFSKYAKNNNHRLLFTHSIIPSLMLITLGYILKWPPIIIGGFNYFIHIIIDTFDWGTNFFYFKRKQIGFKLLISKHELANLHEYLAKYKNPASFFDEKYYTNKICIALEVILFMLMVLFNLLFAYQYSLLILIYFIGLWFHLNRHFSLKKLEKSN